MERYIYIVVSLAEPYINVLFAEDEIQVQRFARKPDASKEAEILTWNLMALVKVTEYSLYQNNTAIAKIKTDQIPMNAEEPIGNKANMRPHSKTVSTLLPNV